MPRDTLPHASPRNSAVFGVRTGGVVVVALGLVFLVSGCPGDARPAPDGGSSDPSDAGHVHDAGESTDAGDTADAGDTIDAGHVVLPTLSLRIPNGARRGPIQLGFDVHDGTQSQWNLEWQDGATWRTATRLSADESGAGVTLVWDSFADLSRDGSIPLRFTARANGTELEAPFTLDVRDDPETDRLVLVGHPLEPQSGGGASSTLDAASVVTWDTSAGAFAGDVVRLTVVTGPRQFRANPDGRLTAVLGDSDGTIGLVGTPLDANKAGVTLRSTLTLPHGWPADLQWSVDGRALLVAGGLENSPPKPPVLWKIPVADDLDTGAAVQLAELPGPPSGLAVAKDGRMLVVCGPGSTGTLSHVVLYGADGTLIGGVDLDLGPASSLAFAPDGRDALYVASSFLGDQLQPFVTTKNTLVAKGPIIDTVRSPTGVWFHPASGSTSSLLLTNFDRNVVTPFTLDTGRATPLAAGTAVTQVPLADAIDGIERGTRTGTWFATSTTNTDPGGGQVVYGTLSTNGTATRSGAKGLGTGTTTIPSGVSVQR